MQNFEGHSNLNGWLKTETKKTLKNYWLKTKTKKTMKKNMIEN
jgi:hypothetical protein